MMKTIKVNPTDLRSSEEAIREAAEVIRSGGVIIYPTDTLYGLGADATNAKAIDRVFRIKKRPNTKPVPVIISDLDWAKRLAIIDEKTELILSDIWPGAVTVVLRQKFRLPAAVTAGKRTIALRIPHYKLVYYLTRQADRPLTATSANISGEPPSTRLNEVLGQFAGQEFQPDLVLDAGELNPSEPSTILDLSGRAPKISRLGPVSKDDLFKILSLED